MFGGAELANLAAEPDVEASRVISMPNPLPSAGAARVDITPQWPVMQGGFGQRTQPSQGVLDAVLAKALFLQAGDEALLIITADLICIPKPLAQPVIEALMAQTGLAARQICLCASHTHSGPQPWDTGGAPGVAQYSAFLREALIAVALAARARAVPCRVGTGAGAVDVFLNRRTRGNPNIVDPRVAVLAVQDAADGHLLAVLFGVGCHPVTLGWDNMQISGDFPGVAQRLIEGALQVDHALFFNSTEGNVIPVTSPNRNSLDPRGYQGGDYADTQFMGEAVANEVQRVVRSMLFDAHLELGSARQDLRLNPRNAEFDLESATRRLDAADAVLRDCLGDDYAARANGYLWALASQHVVAQDSTEVEMRRLMVACCEQLGLAARVAHGKALNPVQVPVQVMRINALELLALPGEVLVEVGQEWTLRTANPMAFIVGLANAHLRYLPRAAHFDEPDADVHYETITAGLEPQGVERALDAATRMLAELRGHGAAWT